MTQLPWWTLAAVLASWSAGVLTGQLLSPLWPWLVFAGFIAAIAVGIRRARWMLIGLSWAALVLGSLRGATSAMPELPAALVGQRLVLSGQVDDDPVDTRGSRRLTLRVDRISGARDLNGGRLRILATVYGLSPVRYGDLVVLSGVLERPSRLEQFDYRTYLAEQGITALLRSPRLVRVMSHAGDPLHGILVTIRHALVGAVNRVLPEPQAALVLGVVFGYRAALPSGLQQQMIASGLVHIVVASGLNIAMLARMVQRSLGRVSPSAASVVGLLAIAGYAVLSGASPAALRATVMGAVVIVAAMLRRESQIAISLALTSALMLGVKPGLARDVGFQLSFGATLGIVLLADSLASRLGRLPGTLREALTATVAAQALTWPILLAQVHQVSLIAPLANLLVVPLVPLMMVLGAAGSVTALLVPAAGWLPLQLAGAVARWFQAVIEVSAKVPFASVAVPYFPPRWLAAGIILNSGLIAGIKLRQFFWRRRVWAGLGAAGVAAISVLLIRPDGLTHVYALDVGSGSAVLIRTPDGQQLLIDSGPDPERFIQSVGRALPPTARTIDLWLITSGRRNNIGAGSAVLNRFHVNQVMIAEPGAWSASLRSLVQQAQAGGVAVATGTAPREVDGVRLLPAGDEQSWLILTAHGRLAVIPPDTPWLSPPTQVDGVIFTSGGPLDWSGSGRGYSVIQVAARSRDGRPVRHVEQVLSSRPIYRTDRLGSVELIDSGSGFVPVGG